MICYMFIHASESIVGCFCQIAQEVSISVEPSTSLQSHQRRANERVGRVGSGRGGAGRGGAGRGGLGRGGAGRGGEGGGSFH